MDFVYTCREGDNEELRYSLRSLEKNFPQANVWIVGNAPSWYIGKLIKTPLKKEKYLTVRSNLKILCETNEINENFVLMNDDFFIMKPMNSIEVWHGGPLFEAYKSRSLLEPYSTYTNFLKETYKTIMHSGVANPISYELHTPLPITKSSLAHALTFPGLWRSIAANYNNIGGTQHEDVKLYVPRSAVYREIEGLMDMPYISSDDESFNNLLDMGLRNLFSKPSSYER
jgi:hypothetical protein